MQIPFQLDAMRGRSGRKPCVIMLMVVIATTGLAISGCKKSNGAVKVGGHIKYRGNPLNASSVTFFPGTGRPITAPAPQGEYSAELLPGEYTAIIDVGIEYPPGFKEGDPQPAPKVVLPPQYTSREKSTLKATVASGQDQPIDFDLK